MWRGSARTCWRALRAASGAPITALLDLQAPPLLADPLAFVDSIHEALYDSDIPLTLVLDDVQHLNSSDRALEVLDRFLQWAPASTRVVLIGRTVPRLRLQRLRLEDRLELIGHRDLAFSEEETAAAVMAVGLVDVRGRRGQPAPNHSGMAGRRPAGGPGDEGRRWQSASRWSCGETTRSPTT